MFTYVFRKMLNTRISIAKVQIKQLYNSIPGEKYLKYDLQPTRSHNHRIRLLRATWVIQKSSCSSKQLLQFQQLMRNSGSLCVTTSETWHRDLRSTLAPSSWCAGWCQSPPGSKIRVFYQLWPLPDPPRKDVPQHRPQTPEQECGAVRASHDEIHG